MPHVRALKESSIFSDLSAEQIEEITRVGEQYSVPEGATVFEEGHPGVAMYILIDGRIQITVEGERPNERVPVHTVVPGRIFGEFALIGAHERSATARTTKDSIVFRLSREAFTELTDQDAQLGYVVYKRLSHVLMNRLIKTTRELRSSLLF